MAFSAAADIYRRVARESIQVFGGVGLNWEHQAHRHFRRAATVARRLARRLSVESTRSLQSTADHLFR